MAKFGKFLLTTAALAGTAATAYFIYKNKDSILTVTKEEESNDEDYDDFSDSADAKDADAPHYVPLNNESTPVEKAKEAVENIFEKAAEAVEEKAEEFEKVADAFEEKVADIVDAVEEKTEDAVDAVEEKVEDAADTFSTLPEQMAVEESVEEFFNDDEEN